MIRSLAFSSILSAALAASFAAHAETAVERGAYLVKHVAACGNCHSPLGPEGEIAGQELSGRFVITTPAFDAWAPNITPAAVGDWSDAELARAIREGIRPDGSVIGPPMPMGLYRGLSDSDLASMVAYLRTIPAIENETPRSTYRIPLPPAYGPPVEHVADVDPADTVAYGAYLAGPMAHCTECHTPMGADGHFDFENRLGAGGFQFEGPWGISVSSNLTSAPDALARWSDEDVIAMIRTGRRPDGSPMAPPMGYPFYAGMSDGDVRAIVAFLRTLPPRSP